MDRLVVVAAEIDLHALIPDLARSMVVGRAFDHLSRIVQPDVAESQDGVIRSHQKLENRQDQPVGNLPAKLPVHLARDEEAAAQLRS